jgi:hypothetical protein
MDWAAAGTIAALFPAGDEDQADEVIDGAVGEDDENGRPDDL